MTHHSPLSHTPAASQPPALPQSGSTSVDFHSRHIGFSADDQAKMLAELGYESLESLVDRAVPKGARNPAALSLPQPLSEAEVQAELRAISEQNDSAEAMLGLGYYGTVTPAVIRRNVVESPAWYTAYTPYQPEISQGRLEALINFQTMVADLTGLTTSNASLLDEGTAVAEAMTVMRRTSKVKAERIVVDADLFPQSIAVLRTRCAAIGVEVHVADLADGLPEEDFFGVVVQYPGASGVVRDHAALTAAAHERGALVAVSADLLALTLLAAPGDWGADIAVGSTQRFGVPMGYGGPHAGYMAVRDGLERSIPGRLVGVSVDSAGRPAYRLALQTREQHIRRDKATSNICTAQVLLAVVASMYAVYHGPEGLRAIASGVHRQAVALGDALRGAGAAVVHDDYFDTVLTKVPGRAAEIVAAAAARGVHLREVDADHVGISCSETTTGRHLAAVLAAFGAGTSGTSAAADGAPDGAPLEPAATDRLPGGLVRTSGYLTHPVFSAHHSETQMLRYLRSLSDKDYALDRGMIPLGSCTMKLNATTEMEPISLPGFAALHPFVPASAAAGYTRLVDELETWLAEVTGYAKVSIQPNAGSQGELAGLLAIRGYHRSRGEGQRDVCLIPASAHGTNAASAVMAGMRVVVVKTAPDGTVDLDHLRTTCEEHSDRLAAIMVTYPSTHGVYEEGITELCQVVHAHGGQVYVDGANLNALLGLAAPGAFGGDVSHLNLHKTFCIPHGGGGPGVGPVAVAEHLVPFLPSHPFHPDPARRDGVGPVSAAPFGSASILPISWAYVRLMGAEGLTQATKVAVLAANYVAARLAPHYPTLYTGEGGLVAHECILDLRPLTKESGVTVDDVAKRLIDYGFHAPTMSFPVAGTLMVEPTESEDLGEIDRFIDAMIAIRAEIDAVIEGTVTAADSPLRHAPHTARSLVGDWDRAYSREEGVYPAGLTDTKYWPPVGRIDQSHGDRNLVCSCPPPEAFEN
ncbi:aminomethyl-transferring glycine dehydrogenase [Intrasporangium calvum]|uniref:aminomethyl-transferring glycine dehydrogenase n=1 Tax=Intrasporangium calvum TaxID=53358 RepID=UPI000DF63833|nr:aminomethyl-transferring glycine dehydrogenase [Intrasporangium calvum]AXG14885.1 glycine dehydrogenase (aminomethyl-transferring) [Intrasporangium calvum]